LSSTGRRRARIENGKIYKGGSTWASVSDAKRELNCDDGVAATLWVLFQIGVLGCGGARRASSTGSPRPCART
jgi:hypothetical protein